MEKHPIENIMSTTMENIRDMVDVDTVIGEAIVTADGSTVIPVSKVSFGFVAGGGEYERQCKPREENERMPFAGGTGAGVSVQPVGFLVVSPEGVKMLPAQTNGAVERVVELLPQLIEELNGGKKDKPSPTIKAEVDVYAEDLPEV